MHYYPPLTPSKTATALANLPSIQIMCAMMSERMMHLYAEATGAEALSHEFAKAQAGVFLLDHDYSHAQLVILHLREEYRSDALKAAVTRGDIETVSKKIRRAQFNQDAAMLVFARGRATSLSVEMLDRLARRAPWACHAFLVHPEAPEMIIKSIKDVDAYSHDLRVAELNTWQQ